MNVIQSKLLTPKTDEQRNDFVRRCMESSKIQSEFPSQKQRLAVCENQFQKAKKNSRGAEVSWDTFENDSILFLI